MNEYHPKNQLGKGILQAEIASRKSQEAWREAVEDRLGNTFKLASFTQRLYNGQHFCNYGFRGGDSPPEKLEEVTAGG